MSDERPVAVDLNFKIGWVGWLVLAAFTFCTCTYTCGNFRAGGHEVGCGQPESEG